MLHLGCVKAKTFGIKQREQAGKPTALVQGLLVGRVQPPGFHSPGVTHVLRNAEHSFCMEKLRQRPKAPARSGKGTEDS